MPSCRKTVVISDLHYGLGKNSKTKLRILDEHVEPAILSELESGGERPFLVVCGDLFHEMVSVRTDVYKKARSFIERCASLADVAILAGNHDCFDDTTDITSIELFDRLDNVEVIRFPEEKEIFGKKCLFLPWSENNEYAFRFKDGSYDAVFCHPDVPKEFFSGLYVMENGRKMSATEKNRKAVEKDILLDSGLDSMDFSDGRENDRTVSGLESVRKVVTLAKEGGTIFAGHIHKHSESCILGRNFMFVGSPYQTTSEEMGSRSGYYVISGSKTEFRDIASPEYVEVKFSDVKRLGVENYDFSKISGNIVRFDGDDVISVELEAKMRKAVTDAKPFEVADTDYSNLVSEPGKVDDAEEYQKAFSESPKSCIDLYIDNMGDDAFSAEKVSRKKVKETFDALYGFAERKSGSVSPDGGGHVTYKKLVATNFLSYDSLEFDFVRHKGLTLIYGKNLDNPGATNACGKSNIIKALVYGLFGRFPKKVKKENMSQWEDPTRPVDVTIWVDSGGTSYRIESGMAKKSREAYHRVFDETTGDELTKKQLAETRKFIESEILHCGFDMFMKTTVLTSSEIFNFYCMKKDDKDDYLNTIFGTKALNDVRELIKAYLKDNRAEYMERCRLLEGKEQDLALNRTASERFEAARTRNVELLKNDISRLESALDELKKSAEAEKDAETERLETERKDLDAKLRKLNSEISKLKKESVEAERKVESGSSTVKLVKAELEKHKDVIPKLCEDCKKVVVEGYNLSGYANTVRSAKESVRLGKEMRFKIAGKLEKLENDRDSVVRKSMETEHLLKESRTSSGEVERTESDIRARKANLEYISGQENPNLKILEKLESDRKELEKDVEETLSKIRHLDFIQSKVVSQEVVTNLLTSKFIRQLNDRIRYYLQRLGLNLGVEFDDSFHYEFVRGDGAHPEFNSLSGGESLRIVIATSFAFKDFLESRRNISSNIRFLDEFFEKDADNLGMNSTISILKDFSSIMEQNVFLISNKLNEIDPKVFDNVLVVTIKDSKSSVGEPAADG